MSGRKALPVREATALLEARQRAQQGLIAQLAAFVRNVLALLAGPGGEPDEAVSMIVDAVAAGQEQVAALTSAYVDTVLALEQRSPVEPDIDRDALEVEWSRLVDRYAQERTDELMEEIDDALASEIESVSDAAAATPAAKGYRRVIHPELSQGGACGLCIAAAHRVYRRPDLKKLHARCRCTVLPITSDADLGKEINDADLAAVYAAANTKDGWTLKQVRFKPDGAALTAVKERTASGARRPRGEDTKKRSSGSSRSTARATKSAAVEAQVKASLQARIARMESYLADPANSGTPTAEATRQRLQQARETLAARFPGRR